MNIAAIIIFRRSTLPKILNFFAEPRLKRIIEAGDYEDKVAIHIIECPVLKEQKYNRKVAKSLKNLCRENNISFFIGKNVEYYLGSGLEFIESGIERGCIDEIRGIKGLAALIKLSAEGKVNLLKSNMFFIAESYGHQHISSMCEETAGVFIYEHESMDSNAKKILFEKLMEEKGISAVFTKDLSRGISQCNIIIADNSVPLEPYLGMMTGKTLIGSNAAVGDFKKVSQVLLWYDCLESMTKDNIFACYNDETLAILRHFYKVRNPVDFIRRFPYIYLTGN